MDEIEEKIRKIPLAERLEKSLKIVKSIASDGRDLRMSVPVQPTDEDVFLVTTLSDALELINSFGCYAGSDGDCEWSECPQLKNYKVICPLYKICEDE
jgi:hypothetical protein